MQMREIMLAWTTVIAVIKFCMYSEALHTGFAEYMWPLKKKEVKDDCKTFDLSNMKNGITCPYVRKTVTDWTVRRSLETC